jgi:hypothetical protein
MWMLLRKMLLGDQYDEANDSKGEISVTNFEAVIVTAANRALG